MGEFIKDNLPNALSYFEAEGLKLEGRGAWRTTRCEFHEGSDSMRINTQTGGWICMSCGIKGGDVLAHHMAAHGLDFISAAKALGAWHDDGKPSAPQRPKPLPAGDALRVLAFECQLAAIAAGNIANGVQLTDIDRARLLVASQRITTIQEAFA
ncbi:MAG: CHC2 zinc finger domain-containing protein [Gallionella sp.]|nr:CHC2 zinc finger domain-containing protein [Gallionella sp.]